MNLRELDLNLLLVFHEIFRARHISAAAKRLKVTQSAVSNALTRLRRSTGDELFVRTSQGMQPTPFADRMAGSVAAALSHLEDAFRPGLAFDPYSSRRRFRIAMTDVGETFFMPRLVEACIGQAPYVGIESVRAGLVDLRVEMAAGTIDLAIGAFADVPSAFFQRRLFLQNSVSIVRRGHPMGAAIATTAGFMAARHLIVMSMDSPYDCINEALARAGIPVNDSFSVPHFAAVPYIVSTTDLVATVPRKLAERSALPFQLEIMKTPIYLPALQTNMFWHRRYSQDEGHLWLRGLMATLFAE